MSEVRIHNFAISLDGFGTGDGQALDTPFGHAGERLHEWMFGTRFWLEMVGKTGGTEGADHAFAQRHSQGFGAEIMGAGKFGPPGWQDDADWKGWWGPNPPFHSPVFVLTHRPRPRSRWRAAPPSTSSTPHRARRSSRLGRRPMVRTCGSAVGSPSCATSWPKAWSTTCTWFRCRSSSVEVSACGTVYRH